MLYLLRVAELIWLTRLRNRKTHKVELSIKPATSRYLDATGPVNNGVLCYLTHWLY